MADYYKNVLIDTRTSCSREEAVAILLGRRTDDPIYGDFSQDCDPEERQEHFMDWLDISIFEELVDERDGILSELDDAKENQDQATIDACNQRIVQCDATIRRAKLILCDIDDELAKGAASTLRTVSPQTPEISNPTRITLSSLREWAKGPDKSKTSFDAVSNQPIPPSPRNDDDEPLLTAKGGMTKKSAQSFLVTFAILLEEFVAATGKRYLGESGTEMNKQAIIDLLWEKSLPDARHGHFLTDQSKASIKSRIGEVIEKSASLTALQRAKALPSKTVSPKS